MYIYCIYVYIYVLYIFMYIYFHIYECKMDYNKILKSTIS